LAHPKPAFHRTPYSEISLLMDAFDIECLEDGSCIPALRASQTNFYQNQPSLKSNSGAF